MHVYRWVYSHSLFLDDFVFNMTWTQWSQSTRKSHFVAHKNHSSAQISIELRNNSNKSRHDDPTLQAQMENVISAIFFFFFGKFPQRTRQRLMEIFEIIYLRSTQRQERFQIRMEKMFTLESNIEFASSGCSVHWNSTWLFRAIEIFQMH